jgi:nudix-type nucleoside diphosphatase (YffH/AdpP family)
MDHPAEILSDDLLAKNWRPLRRYVLAYRRRDGRTQHIMREVYFNGPGSAVLPIDAARGTVLLIRQYRLPAQLNGDASFLIEACAGVVDPGEDAATNVRKEAEQETGYRVRDVRKVMEVYSSPGACMEKLHLFLAAYDANDRVSAGGGLEEEGEEIEVLEMPLAEAWRLVQEGAIADAKTVLLIQQALLEAAGR